MAAAQISNKRKLNSADNEQQSTKNQRNGEAGEEDDDEEIKTYKPEAADARRLRCFYDGFELADGAEPFNIPLMFDDRRQIFGMSTLVFCSLACAKAHIRSSYATSDSCKSLMLFSTYMLKKYGVTQIPTAPLRSSLTMYHSVKPADAQSTQQHRLTFDTIEEFRSVGSANHEEASVPSTYNANVDRNVFVNVIQHVTVPLIVDKRGVDASVYNSVTVGGREDEEVAEEEKKEEVEEEKKDDEGAAAEKTVRMEEVHQDQVSMVTVEDALDVISNEQDQVRMVTVVDEHEVDANAPISIMSNANNPTRT
jgi:hypothetical protein